MKKKKEKLIEIELPKYVRSSKSDGEKEIMMW